ncbi:MAG: glycosyltransferase family 2 protein [Endomicrobiales bacterium]
MSDSLIIVPSSARADEPLNRELQSLDALYPENKQRFYYDNSNTLELKRLLMETAFGDIVICFPSLDVDFTRIQMIRSLSLESRLIVFCPDVSFIRKAGEIQGADGYSDLSKWYAMGKSIQCSIYRHADLIITRAGEDGTLLLREVPGVPVISLQETGAGREQFPRRKPKKVSIIILTFNQLDMTRQCIESLEKHTKCDYEIIIVDNGSSDGTREYLNALLPAKSGLRLIFNDKNLGFSKANNQGIRIAEGDYFLLLNNDVILTAGWLERLLACAESDPAVGVAGPCTNHAVGQQVVNAKLELDDPAIQKFACMQLMKNAGNWFETHRIIGFCLLARREVIEKIGMLDERFGPGGFEDYDFCLRVKQAGYKIMIAGDVFVYHIGGQGYSQNNLDYDKLRYQNVQIFIEKWVKKALEIMEIMPFGK